MDKYIIICAGESSRWGNYMGTPKHLVDICGETMLSRTVRLLGDKNIFIVVRDDKDFRYCVNGAKTIKAKINENNFDADKFLSSKHLWNRSGRTVVLYGDVYFSEQAINGIMNYKSREWTLFARPFGSKHTGCPYPECFAQSFYPEDHKEHLDALYKIKKMMDDKEITRSGGWEHYKVMCGGDPSNIETIPLSSRIKIIDDYTEDFDKPSDYKMWKYSVENKGVIWQYIKAKNSEELLEKANKFSKEKKAKLEVLN